MPQLLRIQPQEGVPSRVPYGQASAADFGADVSGAIAQGAQDVSRSALYAVHQFQVAEANRRKVDDQIQRGIVLAQLGETVTEELQELRLKGLEPEQYEAEGARLIQQRVQAAQATIRDPQGQQRFQLDAAQFTAKARTELKTEAYKGKLARMGVEAVGAMTRHANETVWGVTPEAREDAYAKGLAMSENMAKTGVWSADEAQAKRGAFLGQVERGSIDRDARNPTLVGDVLALLSKGAYVHIPSDEQSRLMDHILSRGNAARIEADRLRKEQQEENERGLAVRIRDAVTPEDLMAAEDEVRGLLVAGARGLLSEKGEHFFKQIDAKRNPPEHDDPTTVRRLQPRVYGLHTTETSIAALETQVDAALENGTLTPTRHATYMNKLDQKRTALKANPLDKLMTDEHRDVEGSINRLIRTKGSLSPEFDAQTEAIRDEAIMEHNRVSRANGGAEPSRDWWDRRRPYYIARTSGITLSYAQGVLSGIPEGFKPVGGFNPDKPDDTLKAIDQAFLKLRADMVARATQGLPPNHIETARKLSELLRLNRELAALRWQGKDAEAAAKATPSTPTAKPGQVQGRPR